MLRWVMRIRKRYLAAIAMMVVAGVAWVGRDQIFLVPPDDLIAPLVYEQILGDPGTQDTLERRPDLALHLSWSDDNSKILARQHDGNIVAWDLTDQTAQAVARTQAVFAYCPAESRLLVNIENNAVLLGLKDGLFRKISDGRHDHAAFSADCSTLAIAREDENRVRLLRGSDWSEVRTEQPVRNSLMLSLDGAYLAAAGGTFSEATGHRTLLEVFDIASVPGERSARVSNPDEILGLWSMAFSADGTGLMLGSQVFGHSGLRHISTRTGETRWGRDGFDAYWVRALGVSPDGVLIATGDENGMLRVWEVDSGVLISEFATGMVIQSLGFSTDGRRLAVGLWDGTIGIVAADTLLGHARQ